MTYIPKKHRKFRLLQLSKSKGLEVFDYPDELLDKVQACLRPRESVFPAKYGSYEEYFDDVDYFIEKYADDEKTLRLLKKFRNEMESMNNKDEWSVCKYIGNDYGRNFGFTHGNYYYWPCSATKPEYRGVIDNEEYTTYRYPIDRDSWIVADDPTGMAFKTIFGEEYTKTE